jgi:hypothetical protein
MSRSSGMASADRDDNRPGAAIDRRSFLASGAAVVAVAEATAAHTADAFIWDREDRRLKEFRRLRAQRREGSDP